MNLWQKDENKKFKVWKFIKKNDSFWGEIKAVENWQCNSEGINHFVKK